MSDTTIVIVIFLVAIFVLFMAARRR